MSEGPGARAAALHEAWVENGGDYYFGLGFWEAVVGDMPRVEAAVGGDRMSRDDAIAAWGAMLEDIIGAWGVEQPDKDDVLDILAEHKAGILAALVPADPTADALSTATPEPLDEPDWLAARGLAATATGELVRDIVYRHQVAAGLHYCAPFTSCAESLAAIADVLLTCRHEWSGPLDKHPTCVRCGVAYRAALRESQPAPADPTAPLPCECGCGYPTSGPYAALRRARLAPADPTADLRAALPGHPSPDRGSGPWVLRLVCCGYDDGIERYATWDEADTFRQSYVTGPGGHDRAAILTRDLDTTYHRRRVARRRAALAASTTEDGA